MKDFRFAQEEIDGIKAALRSYDKNDVSRFFYALQRSCQQRLHLKVSAEATIHHKKVMKIGKHLDKALTDIKELAEGFPLIPKATLDDLPGKKTAEVLDFIYYAGELAIRTHPPVAELSDLVQKAEAVLAASRPMPEKQRAEAEEFIKNLALLFYQYIGKPSIKSSSGFLKVVKIVFNHFGFRAENKDIVGALKKVDSIS